MIVKKPKITPFVMLLTASIAGMAAAINGNIPAISKAFPQIHLSSVELLSTIPSFFLIFATICTGLIAKKIGIKTTMLLGIAIDAFCGVLPAITHNFYIILTARALFGFGTGLFYPLLILMINDLYRGTGRVKLLGLQGGVQGLGGIVLTALSGQLLFLGWQVSFWAYACIFPILVLFYLFVPDISAQENTPSIDLPQSSLNGAVFSSKKFIRNRLIIFTATLFIAANLFMILGIKITAIMKLNGYGADKDGSIAIIFICIGSLAGGASFSLILKHFKTFTLILGLILLSAAMLLIGSAENIYTAAFAAALAGFSTKVILPYFLNELNNYRFDNKILGATIFLTAYNMGLALSPFTSMLIEYLPCVNTLGHIFYVNSLILIFLASVLFLYFIFSRQKKAI
ncbi:MFS transporter [Flavobacterium sp. MC2016-06]|jgi:MFS family permease|uniref:MFS transporter n=1 Tax=Flavobacterium sp. MC2016-06 TaxID=2676308 RepID=UPI0012BAAEBC|nr:MFS transporter [Flavobacterium sp. MC2016-06]MBU3860644.1 MFS transporter [Flavobacterium sp. MC2016-06]